MKIYILYYIVRSDIMPGFVVHIAVAQEYLKKHNKSFSEDFILGSIDPDFTNNK